MKHFVYCAHGEQFAELVEKSQDTVRKHHPDAAFTVYTDKNYGIEGQYVVGSYHAKPFMLMNVMCQTHWLLAHPTDGTQVAFLDADVFLRKPLEVEQGPWDVTVTWRDNMGDVSMLMPYNYGVVIANRTVQSSLGWAWMAHRITELSDKNQGWYGNQIALRELCGPVSDGITTRDHGYFDIRVNFLPCETHNFTPADDNPYEISEYVVALHFKGNRKELGEHYYREIMQ